MFYFGMAVALDGAIMIYNGVNRHWGRLRHYYGAKSARLLASRLSASV